MSSQKVHRITAPSVLKAFAAMGIKSGEQYLSIDEDTLRAMMKGKGFTQYQKRYIMRAGLRNKHRGWAVEFGEPNGGSLAPNFSPAAVSLRDYFAAKAMQGIVAGVSSLNSIEEERVRQQWQSEYPDKTWGEATAEQAYYVADAMLKVREQ